MCPVCLASVGMIVAGVTSAGGLTAIAVKWSRKKNDVREIASANEKSNEDVNQNSR
jgi:hypothetical protein